MTQTALPTKPLNREPLCIGSACEYEWRAPDPARLIRFGGWRLTHVDPECTAHGHMTRVNVAALLRFGD